ncbi:transposase zinc-binding domain-containing protein [Sorangium sp. So ce1099]|uniref:transposase zinc-binding domain-containing protein n=1 Tax=Sorangium sp. So ce1099 TaxID=3133331 RepID=UPI003F5E38A2
MLVPQRSVYCQAGFHVPGRHGGCDRDRLTSPPRSCGHDVLVAFSCKLRGPCPSCVSRRMCNEAATLVDRILPNVPVRQWVMSLPFELRALAAKRSDVLAAMERIFAEEIARVTTRLASIAGARRDHRAGVLPNWLDDGPGPFFARAG